MVLIGAAGGDCVPTHWRDDDEGLLARRLQDWLHELVQLPLHVEVPLLVLEGLLGGAVDVPPQVE